MSTSAFFVSDLHLGTQYKDADPGRAAGFETFLRSLIGRASHLFLLGDVFEFWMEYRSFIPKEHFTFFGSDAQTGLLIVMSPQAVSEGESMVFTSNKLGDPEKFTLNYSLTIPRNARAGNYNSDIKYSITTL